MRRHPVLVLLGVGVVLALGHHVLGRLTATASTAAGFAVGTWATGPPPRTMFWNGAGSSGQGAGAGTATLSSPVQASAAGWSAVSGSASHSCGLQGTALYCWGDSADGQLGTGSTTSTATPTPVVGGPPGGWASVSAGAAVTTTGAVDTTNGSSTCAVGADASLWCWGSNNVGQLGLGDQTDRTVPAQVAPGTTWTSVDVGGEGSTCGIRTDGTLWCWGNNTYGQLGTSPTTSTTPTPAPAQVGTATTWRSVQRGDGQFTCGVRTDDTLWCWGRNNQGQAGSGSTTPAVVPQPSQVPGSWSTVASGLAYSCAVSTTGDMSCWGTNGLGGPFGLTTTGAYPTPVAAPSTGTADGPWTDVFATFRATCGLHAGGVLQCWGYNLNNVLGTGSSATTQTTPTTIAGGPWVTTSMSASGRLSLR